MDATDLSQQREDMEQAIDSLKHNGDAQVAKDIARRVDKAQAIRRNEMDTLQESLQALSRRLQTAKGKVDTAKAQREQKSHAEAMRDLREEKQTAERDISSLGTSELELEREIENLEKHLANMDENIEQALVPDVDVLQLQVLRGLGVEPLVSTQSQHIDKARVVSPSSVSLVSLKEGLPSHQMAAQLWGLCASR